MSEHPLRNSEDVRKRLYLQKRPVKTDVIADAKRLVNSWTCMLDAPTKELRMIERLIKVIDCSDEGCEI